MNRFIIVDGLPYLYADGKAYAVRWIDDVFTVGAEVELASVPAVTYSELSIKAKCHSCLNSIDLPAPLEDDLQQDGQEEPKQEGTQDENGQQDGQEEPKQEALEDMTVAQLKEYAEEKGIDLNGATKKADIIEAIKAAE